MAYRPEFEDTLQSVRRGNANEQVFVWPKHHWTGNVTVATASIQILGPSGDAVLFSESSAVGYLDQAKLTTSYSGGHTKLVYTFSAAQTSGLAYDDGYRAVFRWVHQILDGALALNKEDQKTVLFDICKEPYVLGVSLQTLQEEELESGLILQRQAEMLISGRTAEQHAAAMAWKAWADVREWIRSAIAPRPIAITIMDSALIDRVVAARTLARMHRAEGGGIDSPARQAYEDWAREAWARFKALPPFRFDTNDDGHADTEMRGPRVHRLERSWE